MINNIIYLANGDSIGWTEVNNFAKQRDLGVILISDIKSFFDFYNTQPLVVYNSKQFGTFVQNIKKFVPINLRAISIDDLQETKIINRKNKYNCISKMQTRLLFLKLNIYPTSVSAILIQTCFSRMVNYGLKKFSFKLFKLCCEFLQLDYKKETVKARDYITKWYQTNKTFLNDKYGEFYCFRKFSLKAFLDSTFCLYINMQSAHMLTNECIVKNHLECGIASTKLD